MREIKFRAWHKKLKAWVTGGLISMQGEYCGWEPWNMDVTQYTGLKDKNGKEIYEGDIISGYSNYFDAVQFKAVIWANNGWQVSEMLGIGLHSTIEVAGNIFQNPELLTTTV